MKYSIEFVCGLVDETGEKCDAYFNPWERIGYVDCDLDFASRRRALDWIYAESILPAPASLAPEPFAVSVVSLIRVPLHVRVA